MVQVARAVNVDGARRVVVGPSKDREEVEVLRGSLHRIVRVLQAAHGDAGVRLASCAATKASAARPRRAFAILVSTSSGVSNPSTVESRAASALASALPARAASRTAVVTAFRRAARESVDGRQQGVRGQGADVRLAGLQPRDGGVSTCELVWVRIFRAKSMESSRCSVAMRCFEGKPWSSAL